MKHTAIKPTSSLNPRTETDLTDKTYLGITNDQFLTAIFGDEFKLGKPLVCSIVGDPNQNKSMGWPAKSWPCDTSDGSMNWYALPSLFEPNTSGRYRAQKNLAGPVFCVMLDDIGTKVPKSRLDNCPPTWLIETSPTNFQAGYVFAQPLNKQRADSLKVALIEARLCDAGASGGAARWMRLPVAINGKAKYGTPAFQCKLTDWHPERRYTIEEIINLLELPQHQKAIKPGRKAAAIDRNATAGVYTPRSAENEVVTAIKIRGFYKSPLGSGKHDITCPWLHEHTDQIDHGSAYFEPTDLYPIGGYKCQHGHSEKYRIGALLEFLSVSFVAAKHKPTIKAEAGEIGRIADASEKELAATKRYYQRGGLIVSIATDPESRETSIKPMSQPALLRALSDCAIWTRYVEHKATDVVIDPPAKHVTVLFDSESYQHLPVLTGIARQPQLRKDGSLIREAGFDSATGLFGVFDSRLFNVPEFPTREQALNALAELRSLLTEFDFSNAHDEAAALAAILTAVIRPSLPVAPMFHIKAPQIASGKSYLSGIIAAFAGPTTPAAVAFPTTDEECQKLLLATLLAAPGVVVFDNMTSDLIPYKSLCSALTEEFLTGRILGISKTATVGTRALFLSSGNNVNAVRDMARRCITISLTPEVETPATRSFKGDPLATVRADRERYVSLALTIIRSCIEDLAPLDIPCKPLASYSQWSEWVRQPLLQLGLPDPVARVFEQLAQDPDRETLGRLLHAWKAKFGSSPTMIREAEASTVFDGQELREVLLEIAEVRGEVNRRRLGRWISRHQGRIVDGLKFEKASGTTSSERWYVKSVMSVKSVTFAAPA